MPISKMKKVSKKQLIANRQNAKKTNGPNTAEGKEIVKKNAFKHGLYSNNILINSPHLKESKTEYEYLLNALVDELEPKTPYQFILVGKIVNCLWRSRRVINAETSQINRQLREVDSNLKYEARHDDIPDPDEIEDADSARIRMEIDAQKRADMVGIKLIPDDNFYIKILHYEMRLNRQMSRVYNQLRLLQLRASMGSKSEQDKLLTDPIDDIPESTSV